MTPRRLRDDYPAAHGWLVANETELRARSGNWGPNNWYAYSRRQNLELFEEPKVLVPYMVEDLCAHFDTKGHWFVNVATGGYGIPASAVDDAAFIAALLSSRLLSWVLARRSRAWRGGWYAARNGNLVRLPIAEPGIAERASILEKFERCIEATTMTTRARYDSDKQLAHRVLSASVTSFDRAVADLYSLSATERALLNQ